MAKKHARKSRKHAKKTKWYRPNYYVTGPHKSVAQARKSTPGVGKSRYKKLHGHVKKWGKRYYKVWTK